MNETYEGQVHFVLIIVTNGNSVIHFECLHCYLSRASDSGCCAVINALFEKVSTHTSSSVCVLS